MSLGRLLFGGPIARLFGLAFKLALGDEIGNHFEFFLSRRRPATNEVHIEFIVESFHFESFLKYFAINFAAAADSMIIV